MATVDAQQLRALIAALHRPDEPGAVIAVRADALWTGPEVLDGTPSVRVVPCASPLAVRAALVDHAGGDQVVAIVTPCTERELGPDVLARLTKARVLSVDPFAALLALFDATVLDPTLVRDDRALIDELIELAPPGGWVAERPLGGVLDADLAWRVWHIARFDDHDVPASLEDAIVLGDDAHVATALAELPAARRARLATRWAGGAAPVDVLLDVIAAGRGADLTALGLVAGVLWAVTDDAALAQQQTLGRARFEPLLGRERLSTASAAAWAAAATSIVTQPNASPAALDRAEQLLDEADVRDLAALSDVLPRGFDRRLATLARTLGAGDLPAAVDALAHVHAHRVATWRTDRVAVAEAAVRLLRRNEAPAAGAAGGFADAVRAYSADGAWVDRARRVLAGGDGGADLTTAYAQLCAATDELRRGEERSFAARLAEWSASEPVADAAIVPVEEILDRVVAPAARAAPVLLVVCDGMGLSVASELFEALAAEDWMQTMPEDQTSWPIGVAMLPTVTEVSRTSLLCGRRVEGGQAEERNGFAGHPALRAASPAARPPVLFHKGQLVGTSGRSLPAPVETAIADPGQRVVGVVVNAVDDHLDRGQQIGVRWDVGSIGPLRWLLDAARDAERVVVFTADHGHVIHGEGATLRPAGSDGGERWRKAVSPARDDEIEVAGPRVLKGGRVVLPSDERVRYGGHKHGYHGGATAQEVLVPVTIVARRPPPGWKHQPILPPAWWTGAPPVVAAAAPVVAARPVVRRAPTAQPTLFEPEPQLVPPAAEVVPAAGVAGWVGQLLATELFRSQQVRVPRPVAAERIAGYLTAIHANGDEIPLAVLAARTGEPADQLRMTLAVVQRVVNVDGAEVLAVRGDATVQLNIRLLAEQFGIALP